MKKNKAKRPYVKADTIFKAVKGKVNYPGEAEVCQVGKYKVLLSRAEKLDRSGNPIYTATVINEDGSHGKSCRSAATPNTVVSWALKKNGVDTKHLILRSKK